MATATELLNRYNSLASVHYSADNFYNQSFVDRIADAQRNIDNLVAEKDRADSKRAQSQDAYDTFFGNMRDYSSLNDEAENKFGVQTSMENYEKSKRAVLAVEQQMDALPSTINRNSGVVMSQQRRELAFNTAADKWSKTMGIRQNVMDVHKEAWDKARENANAYAEQLYGEQQDTLKSLALQWSTNSSLFNTAMNNWQNARTAKQMLEDDYRSWQWGQAEIQNQYARARAQDALNAYQNQLRYAQIVAMEQAMLNQRNQVSYANADWEYKKRNAIEQYYRQYKGTGLDEHARRNIYKTFGVYDF